MLASLAIRFAPEMAKVQSDRDRGSVPWMATEAPEAATPALHFSPDAEIYAEGDAATSLYKVVSGMVRTCRFLSDGQRQIDGFHAAGDVFGFEVGATHSLAAEAVSACAVIPYRRRGLDIPAALGGQAFTYAMRSLERAQAHSMLLCRRSAQQKLASFLLEMSDRQSSNAQVRSDPAGLTLIEQASIELAPVELAMTRQDIADYLGLTIETVSRTLSQLERDGVIALPNVRRICLRDRAALKRLSD